MSSEVYDGYFKMRLVGQRLLQLPSASPLPRTWASMVGRRFTPPRC